MGYCAWYGLCAFGASGIEVVKTASVSMVDSSVPVSYNG
jgi:hypothetical protein